MMTGTATVLTVRDLAASIAYYRDALGFAVTFEYGQPTFYACLCRDDFLRHGEQQGGVGYQNVQRNRPANTFTGPRSVL
jgi:catechol 2,3-dioxygenase-like lactoylglutathione lyase family enzyme